MLDCPHCGKPAMTQAQKAWLGPARSVACAACGRQVSVSWLAMLGMLTFVLLAVPAAALLLQVGWYYSVAVLLIGMAAMFVIHARLIPLSRR